MSRMYHNSSVGKAIGSEQVIDTSVGSKHGNFELQNTF